MKRFLFCINVTLFCFVQENHAQFNQSNLPIVVINTNGVTIPDEPKIIVDFKVLYHSDGSINFISDNPHFLGKAGIELRGHSSLIFPKKSYSIELADLEGEETKFPLLGLPSESDWVLIANYDDKTSLKNAYIYHLWAQTGRYSPRNKHVEVIIDNEYMGIYVLTEKIKRDSERINIKKLEAPETDTLKITGGYIIEASRESEITDKEYLWQSSYSSSPESSFYMNFECIYPKKPVKQQLDYIKDYINSFEASLKSIDFKNPESGFRKYIDEESFIDNFLIQEYSLHLDIFARSQFFFKDRGKKMVASPLWDTSNGLFENYTDKWRFSCSSCDPRFFWFERMMEDCNFRSRVVERYKEFRRGFLTYEKSIHYIDSVAVAIQEAIERDRTKWYPFEPGTFADEIQKLKNFVAKRLNWIDNNIISIVEPGSVLASSTYIADINQEIRLVSTCPGDYPVFWTYDTDEGETGSFVGRNIENVLFTKTITYYAKCQTSCLVYSNSVKVNLIGTCPDFLILETTALNPQLQDFKSKYTLTSNIPLPLKSRVLYSAGHSILLSAGFEATAQEVFVAKIEGCR
ncbi:CotH kinase family protein [Emticicia sp. BO119]|uniref:CotH kinase family protein n=1 Tax=Emticicia sp. BO119 TaxID=2757768 RepID=UPI0015EFFA1D|nr:CotH kinase family protein [Emticicia sp. BO119]MBA4850461.1 CotH kinase family protein [Emticicia sp. BO119]